MSTVITSESKVVTNADVFNRAAYLLEEFGWCQGTSVERENGEIVGMCMGYAVAMAMGELGFPHSPSRTFRYIPFNDKPGRTKEEVVEKLRGMAG